MLTKISAITAVATAALNAVVLLGWWNLTTDQITAISVVVVAAGAAVHTWFNPNVPVGVTDTK